MRGGGKSHRRAGGTTGRWRLDEPVDGPGQGRGHLVHSLFSVPFTLEPEIEERISNAEPVFVILIYFYISFDFFKYCMQMLSIVITEILDTSLNLCLPHPGPGLGVNLAQLIGQVTSPGW